MLESPAAREQSEVTGGISLISNSLLTSCPVAVEWLCHGVHSVRPGDTLESSVFHVKLLHQKLVNWQITIRELWIVQFLWWSSANNKLVCGYFSHYKKGKLSSFISLFTRGFRLFVSKLGFFIKAHEHCHLVAISEAPREFRQVGCWEAISIFMGVKKA